METNSETQSLSMIVQVNADMEMPVCKHIFVSPWPEIDSSMDDAYNDDYEHCDAPKELRLFVDEDQTPPELRAMVLNSLASTEETCSGSEHPRGPIDRSDDLRAIQIPERNRFPQGISENSSSYSSDSPSTSTHSLSASTNLDSNSSESVSSYGPRKANLSTFLLSATNLFGVLKHAIKDPSPVDKIAESTSRQNFNSS